MFFSTPRLLVMQCKVPSPRRPGLDDVVLFNHLVSRLAAGTLYSEELNDSDTDHTHYFSTRAKELLQQEMDVPRMSTVLTLMVLCSLCAASAEDTQGEYVICHAYPRCAYPFTLGRLGLLR